MCGVVIVEDEVDLPTRLKATTNSQKSGPILTVRSASMPRSPVARSQKAANVAKRAGRIGADDARKDKDQLEEA